MQYQVSFFEFLFEYIKTGEFFSPLFLANYMDNMFCWGIDYFIVIVLICAIPMIIGLDVYYNDTIATRLKSMGQHLLIVAGVYVYVRSATSVLAVIHEYNYRYDQSNLWLWISLIAIILITLVLIVILIPRPKQSLSEQYRAFLKTSCQVVYITNIRERVEKDDYTTRMSAGNGISIPINHSSIHTIPAHQRALIVSTGNTYRYADVEIGPSNDLTIGMIIQINRIGSSETGRFKILDCDILDN